MNNKMATDTSVSQLHLKNKRNKQNRNRIIDTDTEHIFLVARWDGG